MSHKAAPTAADETLAFIAAFIEANGYPPSVREIAAGTGVTSSQTVHARLLHLRDAGRLSWRPRIARSLRLIQGEG